MVDLDNTLASYRERTLSRNVSQWAAEIKESGIELFMVSNSRRKARIETFGKEFGTGFIMRARKPSPKSLVQAMSIAGYEAGNSAFIGDQIFTDTIAANLAEVVSVIVRPKRLNNPVLALRYALEAPFRAMCKNKNTAVASG